MTEEKTLPQTKFKPGDYIYWNSTGYLIEEIVKIDRGWVYNISAGNSLTTVNISDGDKYFRKA